VIIAIDGPAGSGKSSTARAVARELGLLYLDTGAMYRAVALAFLRAGREATPQAAADLLPDLRIEVDHVDGQMHVRLDGEDVTQAIRQPEVGTMASRVSTLRAVREKLVAEQRRIGRSRPDGVILDGRDIGTVVFPDADLKIFMVADAAVRARRRLRDLQEQGVEAAFDEVLQEIEERDRQDRERALAPLRQADDALVVDTTDRAFEQQVQFVVQHARERTSRESVENCSPTDDVA
jgi:cytidylate kinase